MLISHSHRFIFIHVPRVAGKSVRRALRPCRSRPVKPLRILGHALDRIGLVHVRALHRLRDFDDDYGHLTADELRRRIPGDVFDRYYKFAFVRNPFDWIVSAYRYILTRTDHPNHEQVRRLSGFEEFLRTRIEAATPRLSDYLCDDAGRLMVDYVGRFETLSRDFAHVCDHLKLDVPLPHINESRRDAYHSYYTDETRELARAYFEPDLVRFGYSFEGITGEAAGETGTKTAR